jgi:hypothetical protein
MVRFLIKIGAAVVLPLVTLGTAGPVNLTPSARANFRTSTVMTCFGG